MSDRWSTLDRLNKLKQEGAITEQEFETQKGALLKERRPVPWVLVASAVVLLLVLVPMGIWAASQRHTGQVAVPVAQVTDAVTMPDTAGNLTIETNSNATSVAETPVLNADDLANAFGAVFGSSPTEKLADGTMATFKPSRVVPLDASRAALISTAQGEACHACQGYLRVDYVTMADRNFSIASPVIRSIISGDSWGNPPSYKIFIKPGALVTMQASSGYAGQGCVEEVKVTYKFANAGIVQSKSVPKEECARSPDNVTTTDTTPTMTSNLTGA